ncbi:MAG: DUF3160 domain-containing protein [bacterium]
MGIDGGNLQQLTKSTGDEIWPRVSPIKYDLFSILQDWGCGGGEDQIRSYYKIVYQKGRYKNTSIWTIWDDGSYPIQISPKGQECSNPSWSPNGYEIMYDCKVKEGLVIRKAVGSWLDEGKAAEQASKNKNPYTINSRVDRGKISPEVPITWTKYSPNDISQAVDSLTHPSSSANGVFIFAISEKGEEKDLVIMFPESGKIIPIIDNKGVFDFCPSTSPLGKAFVFTSFMAGGSNIYKAELAIPLVEVLNLYLYPEIAHDPPIKLIKNRFAGIHDKEKEFFHLYEKVRYKKRGCYITADAVLQLYHDVFDQSLKQYEKHIALNHLFKLSKQLENLKISGLDENIQKDLTIYFLVGRILAQAGIHEIKNPSQTEHPYRKPEYSPKIPSWVNEFIQKELAGLPEDMNKKTNEIITNILDFGPGITNAPLFFGDSGPNIDYTQFKPRGHYDDFGIRFYFLSMMWYGQHALPIKISVDLYRFLSPELLNTWDSLFQIGELFVGPSEDISLEDIRIIDNAHPEWFQGQFNSDSYLKIYKEIRKRKKDTKIADEDIDDLNIGDLTAIKKAHTAKCFLFPQRYSSDAHIISDLTVPDLPGRSYPTSLDACATYGSKRALYIINNVLNAGHPELETRVNSLQPEVTSFVKENKQQNLYNGIVYSLFPLLNHTQEKLMFEFTRSESWRDRELNTFVGMYTALKHDTILYAKQPYGAECGGPGGIGLYVERPHLPTPKGFVDPYPELFKRMSELSRMSERKMKELSSNIKPDYYPCPWSYFGTINNIASKLNDISQRELNGEVLDEETYKWIDYFGAQLEKIYVGESGILGYGSERAKLGTALVADIYTNTTFGKVFEIANGFVDRLLVITKHGNKEYLTEGGIFSNYAFTQPMSQRMTDREWFDKLNSTQAPAREKWTNSFYAE